MFVYLLLILYVICKLKSILNIFYFTVLDSWRLFMFIVGLFLFGYSARLSHNSLFYYLCGITIGVTASFVIIILLISRLIPKVCTLCSMYIYFFLRSVKFFFFVEKNDGRISGSKLYVKSLCYSNVDRKSQYDFDIIL